MSLAFRIAVYVPVLFLIAVVVVGQHHDNAGDTLLAAGKRTARWLLWTVILLVCMTAFELLFIGW